MEIKHLVLGYMAGASRRKFVGVNEEASVEITWVQGDHSVVHILLGAL